MYGHLSVDKSGKFRHAGSDICLHVVSEETLADHDFIPDRHDMTHAPDGCVGKVSLASSVHLTAEHDTAILTVHGELAHVETVDPRKCRMSRLLQVIIGDFTMRWGTNL
jgi:hypothetical protein